MVAQLDFLQGKRPLAGACPAHFPVLLSLV